MLFKLPTRDEERDDIAAVGEALAPPPWPQRIEDQFAVLANLRADRSEIADREKVEVAANLELDRTSPTPELRRATQDLRRHDDMIAAAQRDLRRRIEDFGDDFLAQIAPGVCQLSDAVGDRLNELEQLADAALALAAHATLHELPMPRAIARAPALLQFVREFRRNLKSN